MASETLGSGAGLLAAAALMIDYVLTGAVGISAGVASLISALPRLQPHTLALCLGILALLAIVNMCEVRDTAATFIAHVSVCRHFAGDGRGGSVSGGDEWRASGTGCAPPVAAPATMTYLSWWLLAKVLKSGCAAMTGAEAVSNGVMAFGKPKQKKAQRTLTVIIAILIVLSLGIAYPAKAYGLAATDPEGSNYQSVLSLLVSAVSGRGWFYYTTIAPVLAALALDAKYCICGF